MSNSWCFNFDPHPCHLRRPRPKNKPLSKPSGRSEESSEPKVSLPGQGGGPGPCSQDTVGFRTNPRGSLFEEADPSRVLKRRVKLVSDLFPVEHKPKRFALLRSSQVTQLGCSNGWVLRTCTCCLFASTPKESRRRKIKRSHTHACRTPQASFGRLK